MSAAIASRRRPSRMASAMRGSSSTINTRMLSMLPAGSISSAYRKPHTCWQHHAALNGGMTYSTPSETTTAEMAKTVADEGWSVVGVLDRPLSRRLLRAVDEVAARSPDASTAGQLHQLSG